MSNMTVEKVVEKIYELQERRAEMVAKAKEVKDVEDKLRNWLMGALQNNGLSKMGVECGIGKATIFTKDTHRASLADWDEFIKFVDKNKAYELLTHNVSSKAVREMQELGINVPGVNTFVEKTLCIQKR